MNNYQIDLEKILDWLKKHLPKVPNPERIDGLMAAYQHIFRIEANRFEPQPNQEKGIVIISPRSINYHACLALWILMSKPEDQQNLMAYHKSKFEHNDLIRDASFDTFFNSFVYENL